MMQVDSQFHPPKKARQTRLDCQRGEIIYQNLRIDSNPWLERNRRAPRSHRAQDFVLELTDVYHNMPFLSGSDFAARMDLEYGLDNWKHE